MASWRCPGTNRRAAGSRNMAKFRRIAASRSSQDTCECAAVPFSSALVLRFLHPPHLSNPGSAPFAAASSPLLWAPRHREDLHSPRHLSPAVRVCPPSVAFLQRIVWKHGSSHVIIIQESARIASEGCVGTWELGGTPGQRHVSMRNTWLAAGCLRSQACSLHDLLPALRVTCTLLSL